MTHTSASLSTPSPLPTFPASPNILLLMVDQLRYPQRVGGDFVADLKAIFSFLGSLEGNSYRSYFPGFCKLREHAVVFPDHTIASSACTPSRATIMTGQYGPRTGVTQTDGIFKSGRAINFPWLLPDGAATVGDWLRALGYSTHYFGKWHVSHPDEESLEGFGFSNWEASWPEPHGALPNNMATYRDYQFVDLTCSFLRSRALGVFYSRAQSKPEPEPVGPFFAVCSLVNPHDIAVYPALTRLLDPTRPPGEGGSVPVPLQGALSALPIQGTMRVPLNPDNFPQECAAPSLSQGEDLLANNKPKAQFDASIKIGLALSTTVGYGISQALAQPGEPVEDFNKRALVAARAETIPFQLQEKAEDAALGFLQYYGYMMSMVDRHILRVLETLDETGLGPSTVVVFTADHGEYGAAHSMMMEKWHGAYQEVVNVPLLFRNEKLNESTTPRAIAAAQTSHVDLLPTLVGLTGATPEQIEAARAALAEGHDVTTLPGIDLCPVIEAGVGPVLVPDTNQPRGGVMFVSDDMITEPLPDTNDAESAKSWHQYQLFKDMVTILKTPIAERPWTAENQDLYQTYLPQLQPDAVVQPAHVRALRSGEWKLVRYCDQTNPTPAPDEWELYNLSIDPSEMTNLLVHDGTFPTVIEVLPKGLSRVLVTQKAYELQAELQWQEAMYLTPFEPTGAV